MRRFAYTFLVLLITVFSSPVDAQPKELPSADELLARFQSARESYSAFVATSEELTIGSDRGPNVETTQQVFRERTAYATDGSRVNMVSQRWMQYTEPGEVPTAVGKATLSDTDAQMLRILNDGTDLYSYRRLPESKWKSKPDSLGRAFITRESAGEWSVSYHGSPYFGVLFGDHQPVDQILSGRPGVSVESDQTLGRLCYLISARTERGDYKIWLDPERDYNIVRASVVREPEDLIWDEGSVAAVDEVKASYRGSRPKDRQRIEVSLDIVDFENVDGKWIPMEMEYKYIQRYGGGRIVSNERHHRRESIDIDPEFRDKDVFEFEAENGTPVWIMGVDGIQYEWRDGRLIPALSEEVITALNQDVDEVSSNIAGPEPISALRLDNQENSEGARADGPQPSGIPYLAIIISALVAVAAVLAVVIVRRARGAPGH